MKILINKVTYKDERDGKFGKTYSFEIKYDNKTAYYTSKSKDQKKFIEGQECEFTEETRTSKKGNDYLVVKPIYQQAFKSSYGKALQREQSKYVSMGTSYCKDLIVTDKLKITDWQIASEKIIKFMFNLDNELSK